MQWRRHLGFDPFWRARSKTRDPGHSKASLVEPLRFHHLFGSCGFDVHRHGSIGGHLWSIMHGYGDDLFELFPLKRVHGLAHIRQWVLPLPYPLRYPPAFDARCFTGKLIGKSLPELSIPCSRFLMGRSLLGPSA